MTQEHYYDLRPPTELFVISTCIHDWSVNGSHVPLHAYLCPSVRVWVMRASQNALYVCVCEFGPEHVCWCSVLYASEPAPAGIRKVDLGHKYLISVCCPWKSSIYSWPDGKMPLSHPFLSFADKKKFLATGVAAGSSPGVDEVGRTLRQKGKEKKNILISRWWEVIARKLQTDSFHKHPLYCLFAQRRSAIWYNEKPSQMAKHWILCVWYCLTVKPNKCQSWNCWLCTRRRLLALSYSYIL